MKGLNVLTVFGIALAVIFTTLGLCMAIEERDWSEAIYCCGVIAWIYMYLDKK